MEKIHREAAGGVEGGKMNRRQIIQSLTMAASVAALGAGPGGEGRAFPSGTVNHISYQVDDSQTRACYAELLGMKGIADDA